MSFRFSNSPASYQGYINKILIKKLNSFFCSITRQYLYLHYHSLPYISNVIKSKLINKYHVNLQTEHFSIKKTRKLIAEK